MSQISTSRSHRSLTFPDKLYRSVWTPKYETSGLLRHRCTLLSALLGLTQGVVAKYVDLRAKANSLCRNGDIQLARDSITSHAVEAYDID